MPKNTNNREIAEAHEVTALRLLDRIGWARAQDLAHAVWPHAQQKLRIAQRVVRRLRDRHEILSATAYGGIPIYTLAAAGVRRLADLGIAAHHGKDTLRDVQLPRAAHRMLGNEFLIWITQNEPGSCPIFEHEIAARRAGLHPDLRKIPDGLIIHPGTQDTTWIEVERARKAEKNYGPLLDHLLHLGAIDPLEIAPDRTMTDTIIVGQPRDFRRMIKALRERVEHDDWHAQVLMDNPGLLRFARRLGPYDFVMDDLAAAIAEFDAVEAEKLAPAT